MWQYTLYNMWNHEKTVLPSEQREHGFSIVTVYTEGCVDPVKCDAAQTFDDLSGIMGGGGNCCRHQASTQALRLHPCRATVGMDQAP